MRDNMLDLGAFWTRLLPEQRKTIGVAAMTMVVGWLGATRGPMSRRDKRWNFAAAEIAGREILAGAVIEALGIDLDNFEAHRPHIGLLGIRVCHLCGCTDRVACPEGCSWVDDKTCSRCV